MSVIRELTATIQILKKLSWRFPRTSLTMPQTVTYLYFEALLELQWYHTCRWIQWNTKIIQILEILKWTRHCLCVGWGGSGVWGPTVPRPNRSARGQGVGGALGKIKPPFLADFSTAVKGGYWTMNNSCSCSVDSPCYINRHNSSQFLTFHT
jgi:hypothetical protein